MATAITVGSKVRAYWGADLHDAEVLEIRKPVRSRRSLYQISFLAKSTDTIRTIVFVGRCNIVRVLPST